MVIKTEKISKMPYKGIPIVSNLFQEKGFQLMNQKSLPRFPIPELFRISKFKKAERRYNSV